MKDQTNWRREINDSSSTIYWKSLDVIVTTISLLSHFWAHRHQLCWLYSTIFCWSVHFINWNRNVCLGSGKSYKLMFHCVISQTWGESFRIASNSYSYLRRNIEIFVSWNWRTLSLNMNPEDKSLDLICFELYCPTFLSLIISTTITWFWNRSHSFHLLFQTSLCYIRC